MPIWATIYLIVLTGSTFFALIRFKAIPYFWIGETLALSFVYAIFLIFYHHIAAPQNFIYVLLMLLYILYWEFWVYKQLVEKMLLAVGASPKELLFSLMVAFFPLLFVAVNLLLRYFHSSL